MNSLHTTGGRWDCHTHIYGPWQDYALPEDAVYRPQEAPLTALLEMHRKLGISHGVLVQAACYRTDHAALLDALSHTEGQYKGVALLDGSESDSQLEALHDGGIRGVRLNFMGHLAEAQNLSELGGLAERVGSLGWHVLLHGKLDQVLPVLASWRKLRTTLVIDHMARPDLDLDADIEGLVALRKYLDNEHRWIKLSGVDRMMGGSDKPWFKALPHVRGLLAAAPDRAIWGSDWPHPNIQGDVPSDAKLLEFIETACGDTQTADAVLVHNPRRLYL
ncbi:MULTISPECIES: amidohydrolase family protein [unclassified Caballeronia]|uniref:amidohydrolase family protein n=1 Tax=unclassified Caballeronia TaxID=2646786 RepID=UPI00202991D2|nr:MULTISPECIES: amidohydrolase family protein [unclassified Caballeronia]